MKPLEPVHGDLSVGLIIKTPPPFNLSHILVTLLIFFAASRPRDPVQAH